MEQEPARFSGEPEVGGQQQKVKSFNPFPGKESNSRKSKTQVEVRGERVEPP